MAEAQRQLPHGMISRVDPISWGQGGHLFCGFIGWPTDKGNFSNVRGKWGATGATRKEALDNAIEKYEQRAAFSASR